MFGKVNVNPVAQTPFYRNILGISPETALLLARGLTLKQIEIDRQRDKLEEEPVILKFPNRK